MTARRSRGGPAQTSARVTPGKRLRGHTHSGLKKRLQVRWVRLTCRVKDFTLRLCLPPRALFSFPAERVVSQLGNVSFTVICRRSVMLDAHLRTVTGAASGLASSSTSYYSSSFCLLEARIPSWAERSATCWIRVNPVNPGAFRQNGIIWQTLI